MYTYTIHNTETNASASVDTHITATLTGQKTMIQWVANTVNALLSKNTMNYETIVALDLEQCCWEEDDRHAGEIIQIGVAQANVITGEVQPPRSYYVKPDHDTISQYCTKLTGITQRQVDKQGRSLPVILDIIRDKIGVKKTYVTWGTDIETIDQEILEKLRLEDGLLDQYIFRFKHTINLSILFHMLAPDKPKRGRYKLSEALKYFDVDFQGRAHDAGVDAYNTAILAVKMFQKMGCVPSHDRVIYSNSTNTPITNDDGTPSSSDSH